MCLLQKKNSEHASTRGFSLSFLVDYSGTIASRQWRRLPNGGQESQGNNIMSTPGKEMMLSVKGKQGKKDRRKS